MSPIVSVSAHVALVLNQELTGEDVPGGGEYTGEYSL